MTGKTKFTPDTRDKIIQALRGGNYRKVAAEYAGITYVTLRNWLLLAEDPHAPPEYVEFLASVQKAEADAEVADIARIRQASAEGSWQAAAWIRERKNPDRWGRKDRAQLEITGADGGPISVQASLGADPAAIGALAAILQNRFHERQDPLAPQPIEAQAREVDYEAYRIAPGELTEGSPSLALKHPRSPAEDAVGALPALPADPDVAEFVERREAYQEGQRVEQAFTEIVADVEVPPDWGAWDQPGVSDERWEWDDDSEE